MRYELRVTAFDVMDMIHVSTVVTASEATSGLTPSVAVRSVTTVQGTGESDPSVWARDALVAALEAL